MNCPIYGGSSQPGALRKACGEVRSFFRWLLMNDLKKQGKPFVIVEHNLKTLLPLTDKAYILDQGEIVYDGKTESKTLDKMLDKIFSKK